MPSADTVDHYLTILGLALMCLPLLGALNEIRSFTYDRYQSSRHRHTDREQGPTA